MNNLFQGAWKITRIMGIPIRVHFTWFLVFGLITWSLSTYYFPKAAPDLPVSSYWIKGAIAALLLFVSVGLHELSHSIVAKRYRIHIESITLFIFGGVAHMRGEPPHPRAELLIAIAGPVSSLLLAGIFFLFAIYTTEGTKALFSYLSQINFILAIFNLIPGFPMDGGRVLRSILWQKKRNFFYATQRASAIGQKIALFFIFAGLFTLFAGMPGGLWLMLIGWFLYTAAQASYQHSALQEALHGVKVKDIMVKDLITVEPSISIDELVNGYFLRYGFGGFPVVNEGRYLGLITLKDIKNVPREAYGDTPISKVYSSHKRQWEISPDEDALKALEKMIKEDTGRLVIIEGNIIKGMITRNGIARYVQIKGSL
ncbi:MAG: M50 family metallopeptidase [Thermodesulfovibrionales bacterium]